MQDAPEEIAGDGVEDAEDVEDQVVDSDLVDEI